ncbi:hypothetical protein VKT23_017236 [Stygiomarasmius scandens]|uniref:Heterokaryon incompatibility domain-containing protein n=1 Tax=Marasmiellus scandens TaxID=2682957 RepID=A0ABR1IWP4_9AGAR
MPVTSHYNSDGNASSSILPHDNNSTISDLTAFNGYDTIFPFIALSSDNNSTPGDYDTIFPYTALSNEELAHLFISSAIPSHRCFWLKKGKLRAFENPASCRHLMAPISACPHRLIDTHNLQLVEFHKNSVVPSYAILSHRWIPGEEIVYEDFFQPTQSKSGYQKILSACQQARHDGLHYLWVDTCCIKQGNHIDVVSNVTSMYAYYQNAQVCYTYLVDSPPYHFGDSEWFKRGWTLQELLAPKTVIFFDKHWKRIGDKHELREAIHLRTTIPLAVLSGKESIGDIDVLTRMSWSTHRETTRRQDRAYCLQGLLGVTVEPNYEEDPFASFNRLGKALFNAQPELKERLGISDDVFCNLNNSAFYRLLWDRFWDTRYKILNSP